MQNQTCEIKGCKNIASTHECNGDGRLHHHGAIHIYEKGRFNGNRLAWVCDHHWQEDKKKWNKARGGETMDISLIPSYVQKEDVVMVNKALNKIFANML